jgi:hypothetical protein
MSLIRSGLISACLALSHGIGCATQGELPRQAPDLQPPSSNERAATGGGTAAPLLVHVARTRDLGSGELELEVVIERRTSDPVSLEIALPAGAELIDGALRETLDQPGRRIVRKLLLRLPNGVPADDVRVIADARGVGYGVRATTAYRFGRPLPKLAQPARGGTASIANGKRLGKPIPLQ